MTKPAKKHLGFVLLKHAMRVQQEDPEWNPPEDPVDLIQALLMDYDVRIQDQEEH